MQIGPRHLRHVISMLAAAGLALPQPALPQAYPSKPIRLVAPYPPGGIDVYARAMLPKAAEMIGQPIVLDNRGGANGVIGTEFVARSAPDGYTLLWAVASTMVAAHFLMRNVPFDTVRDFTPIIPILDTRHVMAIKSSLPIGSVKELIEYAKQNPGKLSYGSTGVGSTVHLENEAFKMLTGTDLLHVPYKGTAPMMTDALAGRFDITVGGMAQIVPMIAKGNLRLIAVLDPTRNRTYPDAPAMSEIVPGWRKPPNWAAYFGPAGLPRPIVERLHAVFSKVITEPEVQKFIDQSADVVVTSPEKFAAQIREDLEWEAQMVKRLGIQPE